MDTNQNKQAVNGWISSLAISIVCCAVLFVVFAGYLINIKDEDAVIRIRLETIEQRLAIMANEVDGLYHHANIQQTQGIPTNSQPEAPVSIMAPTAATSATGTTALPPPSAATTTVPTPVAQPPAMPATAPAAATAPATAAPAEIPAK